MFTNYLKVAVRNMTRNKTYSVIVISSLVIGLTCSLLVLLMILFQFSTNTFHKNYDNIWRVVVSRVRHAGGVGSPATPGGLAQELKEVFPQIRDAVRIKDIPEDRVGFIRYDANKPYKCKGICADPSLFTIFDFPFISGDSASALSQPDAMVITESTARRLFGASDPVGKTVKCEDVFEYIVTGVVRDVPDNSDIRFDYVLPIMSGKIFKIRTLEKWNHFSMVQTFVLTDDNASPDRTGDKIDQIIIKHLGPSWIENQKTYCSFQPLEDMHRRLNMGMVMSIVIGILVLFVGCINYVNLATARYTQRGAEIGIRKAVGAGRFHVFRQFMAESIVTSAVALGISLLVLEILLFCFSRYPEIHVSPLLIFDFKFMAGAVLVALMTGVSAGLYPSLMLSGLKPGDLFSRTAKHDGKGAGFRNALVLMQFAFTILFIILTVIAYQQLHYCKDRDLGWNKDHVVTFFSVHGKSLDKKYDALKTELMKYPGVVSLTATTGRPFRSGMSRAFWWTGKSDGDNGVIPYNIVDADFVKTFELNLLAGRVFNNELRTDAEKAYIVNEAAVRKMGLKEAVGTKFGPGEWPAGEIVGVIRNYHVMPFQFEIQPMVLINFCDDRPFARNNVSVRIQAAGTANTLDHIKGTLKELYPDDDFKFQFIDSQFEFLFRMEEQQTRLFSWISALAIIIACLGLYGMVAFTIERRTKEIGVRKVLGASVSAITMLLARTFLKWVVIANIMAWPIAYLIAQKWLQSYVYRIELVFWPFVASGIISAVIAFITVSSLTVKAASANPVDSLRYE